MIWPSINNPSRESNASRRLLYSVETIALIGNVGVRVTLSSCCVVCSVAALAACGGGGGGGMTQTGPVSGPPAPTVYEVSLIEDSAAAMASCTAPLFAPGDLAPPIVATTANINGHRNVTGFDDDVAPIAVFPRHAAGGGPVIALDTGIDLTDDIRIIIGTNAPGQYISVQIKGQPLDDANSLDHASEVISLPQNVDPLTSQPFVVHVDTLVPVPMWQLAEPLGGAQVTIAGEFCLGDLVFTPVSSPPIHD